MQPSALTAESRAQLAKGGIEIVSDRTEGNGGVGPDASNGTASDAPAVAPPVGAKRPLGAVVASAIDSTRTLMRKQVELAKIEVTEAVAERAKGAGMMGGAAVLGLFALGFVALAGAAALDLVLPTWAANLIVAVVFVVVAGGLFLVGRKAIRTAPTKPEQTQETL